MTLVLHYRVAYIFAQSMSDERCNVCGYRRCISRQEAQDRKLLTTVVLLLGTTRQFLQFCEKSKALSEADILLDITMHCAIPLSTVITSIKRHLLPSIESLLISNIDYHVLVQNQH